MQKLNPLESAIMNYLYYSFGNVVNLDSNVKIKSKQSRVVAQRSIDFEGTAITLIVFVAPIKKDWQRFVTVHMADNSTITYKF